MTYNKADVMSMVADALGDNPIGLLVDFWYIDSGECEATPVSTLDTDYYVEGNDRFSCHCGSTKVCLIPKNSHYDYVIKIPFTGVYNEDIDGNRYICGKFDIDYIAKEIEIYRDSSSDVQKILAKNEYVGDYCGIPIYVQERANTVYACSTRLINFIPKIAHNEYEYLWNVTKGCAGFCKNFIFDLLMDLGVTKVREILEELNSDSGRDFHDENYGYTRAGAAIIIDYGGFNNHSSWHEIDDPDEYYE